MAGEITHILESVNAGEHGAADQLFERVYAELKRLARQRLAGELQHATLQPTELVHEAYLRLVGAGAGSNWQNRRHFFGAAAETMRRILVDAARRRGRQKRGRGAVRCDVDASQLPAEERAAELLAVDEALERLAQEDPGKAELVKLRYFAGVSLEDAAQMLGISRATASRHWAYAKAWLFDFISATEDVS